MFDFRRPAENQRACFLCAGFRNDLRTLTVLHCDENGMDTKKDDDAMPSMVWRCVTLPLDRTRRRSL